MEEQQQMQLKSNSSSNSTWKSIGAKVAAEITEELL
jgi:hypothetical protein